MLTNYLTSALRHLSKNKFYTLLNAMGLSIGLACFALIGLWVNEELSYDRFHENADRIYRVAGTFTDESGKFDQAVTPPPLAPALIKDFPEVEAAVRIDPNGATVRYGDKQFLEDDILLVDPDFFKMFSFKLKRGDPGKALNDPYAIILSESMTKKYFGDADPIGQAIRIFQYDPDGQGADYKVTGVVEDCPLNSQFHYNFLASFKTLEVAEPESTTSDAWFSNGYYTYFLLRKGGDAAALEAKFPEMLETYMGPRMKEWKISYDYFLQPYTDIHLQSNLRYEIKPTSSVTYVTIFATIGMIVLLLACINYINLSTAYASDRFKEVGVRKVMGAMKNQLVGQYLTESWLLALISLVLSFAWIELSRPLFEGLTGKPIVGLYTYRSVLSLLVITTVAGLMAGLYPSMLLSSFKPVNILKGQLRTGTSGVWLRKSLVVFQYSITIILVIGILVVQLQMQFIQEKDLGFNKDALVIFGVNGSREVVRGYDAFANDIRSNPAFAGIARSNSMIASGLGNSVAVAEDAAGKKTNATVYRLRVDFDYIDVYGMNLVAGRNFRIDNPADSTKAFLVNEQTTKTFGYKDPADAIGKSFDFNGRQGQIIGVVRDFNYSSLQNKVEPTAVTLLGGGFSRIAVRLNGDTHLALEQVIKNWKRHFPNSVLDFRFAEDALDAQYHAERRFSKVFLVFSVVSLAIACMGLFALVSYSVESRTREIGVRKVLGASVSGLLWMLSKEFLSLVLLAILIAVPVGYYFMKEWLAGFAYKVDPGISVFLIAGILVLGIAWLTVSLRSIQAANANPVNSLRTE